MSEEEIYEMGDEYNNVDFSKMTDTEIDRLPRTTIAINLIIDIARRAMENGYVYVVDGNSEIYSGDSIKLKKIKINGVYLYEKTGDIFIYGGYFKNEETIKIDENDEFINVWVGFEERKFFLSELVATEKVVDIFNNKLFKVQTKKEEWEKRVKELESRESEM